MQKDVQAASKICQLKPHRIALFHQTGGLGPRPKSAGATLNSAALRDFMETKGQWKAQQEKLRSFLPKL